jgi:SAM-dependent methyltransferase
MLLDDRALLASAVVANNAMNRERQLAGVNSYARELGFNPADGLGPGGWLDLCCGRGRALIQAAAQVSAPLVGVDLVDAFDPAPPTVTLICASVTTWATEQRFDLITCLHGLHYVGDKLGVLVKAASWLTPTGRLLVDVDLAAVKVPSRRRLPAQLRAAGFTVDARRHRIGCTGPRIVTLPYAYLGADDRAGPNYTGQPAVDAYYADCHADAV